MVKCAFTQPGIYHSLQCNVPVANNKIKSFHLSCIPSKKTNPANQFQVQLLNTKAKLPQKKSKLAAGHDIACAEGGEVLTNGQTVIKTGLAVAVFKGTYGRIAPHSGLSVKNY